MDQSIPKYRIRIAIALQPFPFQTSRPKLEYKAVHAHLAAYSQCDFGEMIIFFCVHDWLRGSNK